MRWPFNWWIGSWACHVRRIDWMYDYKLRRWEIALGWLWGEI